MLRSLSFLLLSFKISVFVALVRLVVHSLSHRKYARSREYVCCVYTYLLTSQSVGRSLSLDRFSLNNVQRARTPNQTKPNHTYIGWTHNTNISRGFLSRPSDRVLVNVRYSQCLSSRIFHVWFFWNRMLAIVWLRVVFVTATGIAIGCKYEIPCIKHNWQPNYIVTHSPYMKKRSVRKFQMYTNILNN